MYCYNCGSEMDDNMKFCPNCGAPVAGPEPNRETAEQPSAEIMEQPVEAAAEPVSDNGFSKALTLMIFSLVGVTCTVTVFTSLLGIIFCAISKGMLRSFCNAGYQVGPRGLAKKAKVSGIFAKVGQVVSTVGLIISIIMFVIFIIFIILAAIGTIEYNQ